MTDETTIPNNPARDAANQGELLQSLAATATTRVNELDSISKQLTGDAADLARTARKAIGNITGGTTEAARAATAAAGNRELYPLGRQDRIEKVKARLDENVSGAVDVAEAVSNALRWTLIGEALPPAPANPDGALASLLATLDRVPAQDRPGFLREVAGRADGDNWAALLVGKRGLDVLRVAAPNQDPNQVQDMLRMVAVEAAKNSSNPKRKRAAEAVEPVTTAMRKALDAAKIMNHTGGQYIDAVGHVAGAAR